MDIFDLPARLHDLDDDGFDSVPPVVFYLALHFALVYFLLGLRLENRKFIFVQVTLVVHVNSQLVVSF